jgi:hypothetical protein
MDIIVIIAIAVSLVCIVTDIISIVVTVKNTKK